MNQASRRRRRVVWLHILILCFVSGAGSAKPAFVVSSIDSIITARRLRLCDAPPELCNTLVVKRLRRSHEDVVATMGCIQAKRSSHLFVVTDDVIRLLLWRPSGSLGCALNVDSMLICAGEEEGFDPLLPFVTRHSIRHDHRVKMTEVGKTVRVIDWGCDVEGVHTAKLGRASCRERV